MTAYQTAQTTLTSGTAQQQGRPQLHGLLVNLRHVNCVTAGSTARTGVMKLSNCAARDPPAHPHPTAVRMAHAYTLSHVATDCVIARTVPMRVTAMIQLRLEVLVLKLKLQLQVKLDWKKLVRTQLLCLHMHEFIK